MNGYCDSWDCNMQTVDDVKKEAVNEYIKAVVEELEENASRFTKKYVTPYGNNGYKDTRAISIHKAIEIVKQGGASEDICKWELKNACYTTSIKHYYSLPTSIVKTFNNCPYCGKKIKVVD